MRSECLRGASHHGLVLILPLILLQECRYVPRVRDAPRYHSRRRPHLDEDDASHTLVCYCATCDEKVQSTLPLRLSETCDCDQYTHWICHTCRWKEEEEDIEYYKTRTVEIWDDDPPNMVPRGLWLGDSGGFRAVCMRLSFTG